MAKANEVPVVPGSDGLIEDDSKAIEVARGIGFPVLIKATAGGGGKGMRVAENEDELQNALQQARNEAQAAFGNGGVLPGTIRRFPPPRRSPSHRRHARKRAPPFRT